MKSTIKILSLLLIFTLVGCNLTKEKVADTSVPNVIFDTDMGNDVDDALAQAMLLNYEKIGKVKIVAMATNKDNPYSPLLVKEINKYYGKPEIPIGKIKDGKTKDDGIFASKVCKKLGISADEAKQFKDATSVLRKALAESADNSVVYCSVGFSTNLLNLINSKADEYSNLNGKDLLRKKVKYLSIMAGDFENQNHPEYNVKIDIPTAKAIFENPPVPIVFSGYEIGKAIRFPAEIVYNDLANDNPVVSAYELFSIFCGNRMNNRQTWDLTSVLYIVSPDSFAISENGKIEVTDNGCMRFIPASNGICRYLKFDNSHTPQTILPKLIEAVKGF